MKFICTVEISLPINRVVELFDNNENRKQWQEGFVSTTPISGSPGAPGAKSRIVFHLGKRKLELIETITARNLPHEISGLYEHIHMVNTMKNCFTVLEKNKTRYDAEIEYTKFNGVVPSLMAFFMPGVFKRQVQNTLEQFKAFAEKE